MCYNQRMRVCIVGKQGVGKTRFYSALLDVKYVNKPTVDFHENKIEDLVLIDTPAMVSNYKSAQFSKIVEYKPDLALVFIDGSRPLSAADLEIIDAVRKMNIQFEIVLGLGNEYEYDILPQLPKNIIVHEVGTIRQIKRFKQELLDRVFMFMRAKAVQQELTEQDVEETIEKNMEEINIKNTDDVDAKTDQETDVIEAVLDEEDLSEEDWDTDSEDIEIDEDGQETESKFALDIEQFEAEQAKKPQIDKLKWIIVGKENAGKSTLVNLLAGQERVKVSDVPGTTRASVECEVDFNGEHLMLKDTAGVKRSNLQYIKYLLEKKALILFIIDASMPLTHSDKSLLNQIMLAGLACVVVLNKIDKISYEQAIRRQIDRLFKFLPIVPISALKVWNIDELIKVAKDVESKAIMRITTSKLNKWIELERHKFHGTKIKYACHISTSPYEVAFFVSPMNHSKQVIAHLRNLFQEFFKLYGVCVKVLMRSARSSTRAANIPVAIKQKRLARRR